MKKYTVILQDYEGHFYVVHLKAESYRPVDASHGSTDLAFYGADEVVAHFSGTPTFWAENAEAVIEKLL